MYLAIAVESMKHPKHQNDYRIWYLETDTHGSVVGIGVKSKEELLKGLFDHYQKTGRSNWRAFKKGAESSSPVEPLDFVGMNPFENTHFGNLPTLSEFQTTLQALQMNLDIRATA